MFTRERLRHVCRQYYLRLSSATIGRLLGFILLNEPLIVGRRKRLFIDKSVVLNNTLLNTLSGTITIGKNAFFGYNVHLLAATHDKTTFGEARILSVPPNGHDIVIGEGAWIASGVIVIGPCEIGHDAVVAAGSVVTRNVKPRTVVAGIPAVEISKIGETPSG
jgi:acetyltransferase-like isoleucine patch superfamily enzyme